MQGETGETGETETPTAALEREVFKEDAGGDPTVMVQLDGKAIALGEGRTVGVAHYDGSLVLLFRHPTNGRRAVRISYEAAAALFELLSLPEFGAAMDEGWKRLLVLPRVNEAAETVAVREVEGGADAAG